MNAPYKLQNMRGLLVPLAIVAAWWLVTTNSWISPVFLPPPEKVVTTFARLLHEGKIITNLKISLIKVAEGFMVGISAGFILGTVMGLSKSAEKIFGPLFNAVRQVPILGWIPILILIFGLTELSKVIFIALGAFYPMTLNTFDGCRQLKKEYLEVAQVFEYGRLRLLWRFTLPSAMPSVLAGIRLSMSEAWMLVIGAEIFFKARGGIGDMMWEAKSSVRMDVVFITILIVGLIGYILNLAMGLLENRLLRWRASN
jgi:sulfonate transport system permease protein